MGYLKKEIIDLEKEFLPLKMYVKNPMFDISPNLLKSNKTISECIFFYCVEGFDEDFEKTQIDFREFDPSNKTHSFKIDYNLLNINLDIEVFKAELKANIDLQEEEYYLDLRVDLEKSQNDIIFKKKLSEAIESINQSIVSLQKQSLNSIQLEVSKLYLKSYEKINFNLKRDYGSFCPEIFINFSVTKDLNGKEFFKTYFEDEIAVNRFLKFEELLIKREYLDRDYHWLKDKISLVRFFKFCVVEGLIKKYYKDQADVLHQLEKRYSINLGDQSKPSKFKKVNFFKGEFSFLI